MVATRIQYLSTSACTLCCLVYWAIPISASADDVKKQPLECNVEAEIAAADQPFHAELLKELWKSVAPVRLESGLAFSHDGSRIVACLPQAGYVVFDGLTGKVLRRHEQPLAAPISTVAISYDGKHAAFGLENKTLVVFDLDATSMTFSIDAAIITT